MNLTFLILKGKRKQKAMNFLVKTSLWKKIKCYNLATLMESGIIIFEVDAEEGNFEIIWLHFKTQGFYLFIWKKDSSDYAINHIVLTKMLKDFMG
jgi:hypothetical protein